MGLAAVFYSSNDVKLNGFDFVLETAELAHQASYEMRSRRASSWVDEANVDGMEHLGADPKIFSGSQISVFGVRRIGYHHKDQVFIPLSAKALYILKGQRKGEKVFANNFLLKAGYILPSYYAPSVNPDNIKLPKEIAEKTDRDWYDHGKELSDRVQKHFTLYHARLSNISSDFSDYVNTETDTEIYTNGRFFYLLDQKKNGLYDVSFFVPTHRSGGSFEAPSLRDTLGFKRVRDFVCEDVSYVQARHEVAKHWDDISGRLWEERKDFCDGIVFKARYKFGRFLNFPRENPWNVFSAAVSAVVFTAIGFKPLEGAMIGSAIHLGVEEGVEWIKRFRRELKAAFAKASDYGTKDCSDIYKKGNIFKTCAKMSDGIDPNDIELLPLSSCNTEEGAHVENESHPMNIVPFIWSMDQRGISSIAELMYVNFPDIGGVRSNEYQNGVMAIKMVFASSDEEWNKEVYYVMYREDLVFSEERDLPQIFKDQLGTGILRIEKPRGASSHDDSVIVDYNLSLSEALQHFQEDLLGLNPAIPSEKVDEMSKSFESKFQRHNHSYLPYGEEMDKSQIVYRSGDIDKPSDIKVLIP